MFDFFFERENLRYLESMRKEDELQNWAVSIREPTCFSSLYYRAAVAAHSSSFVLDKAHSEHQAWILGSLDWTVSPCQEASSIQKKAHLW